MLVAQIAPPQGTAQPQNKHVDILLKVNGDLKTQFVSLSSIPDGNVDKRVSITIQRHGKGIDIKPQVHNPRAILPLVALSPLLVHYSTSFPISKLDPPIYLFKVAVFMCPRSVIHSSKLSVLYSMKLIMNQRLISVLLSKL